MAKVKDVEHDSRGRIKRIVEHDEADIAHEAAAFVLKILEYLADPQIRSRRTLEATITTPTDEGVGPSQAADVSGKDSLCASLHFSLQKNSTGSSPIRLLVPQRGL